jgi:glycine hydroxymethyltransferase
MVPFDTRSPFHTSGVRVGTPAITTRGVKEDVIVKVVDMVDEVIMNIENETIISDVKKRVNKIMKDYPLFAY